MQNIKAPTPAVAAYWRERNRYLAEVSQMPGLKRRYARAMGIYLLRRFLWSFGFFPVFLGFWLPLVFSHFNLVILANRVIPVLQDFTGTNPELQAAMTDTVLIAWLSVGFVFAVFDFILTPFKSPYEYEADIHMRAWEQLRQITGKPADEQSEQ